MSLYVFDTDTLSLLQRGHPEVARCFLTKVSSNVAVTVLTVEEQLSGWYTELRKAKTTDRLAWVYRRLAENVAFLSKLPILTFDESAIARFDDLRQLKINIGKIDLRIAAVALEQNAILVTRNISDFGRVPGLSIEDWSK